MNSKDEYQAELFSNRIQKKYRELRKWARKNRITCFRIYDRDIPEIPVSLDLYEFLPEDVSTTLDCARFISEQSARQSANDPSVETEAAARRYLVLYLYERPYEKPEEEEQLWLDKMALSAAEILHVPQDRVIRKKRARQKGDSQYEKASGAAAVKGFVQEQGQIFFIDLTTYIDTGLFFDHRPLRAEVRNVCSNKSVLNLFCYTGSFSVYAAQGNAKYVESVDLSNTYLAWAEKNMIQNNFKDSGAYVFTRADVSVFLKEKLASSDEKSRYDIIILDPPTFSNSKKSDTVLDINRQWPELVNSCLNLLNPGGVLYFSTNSRRLIFDENLVEKYTENGSAVKISDITAATIPQDFAGTKIHRCWKLSADKNMPGKVLF